MRVGQDRVPVHIGRQIIQQLVLQFGVPAFERWEFDMGEEEFSQLGRQIRRGRAHDVTPVILRGDELAVVRKHHYPPNAYRAPSGDVHPEESFLDGAERQAWEETGLRVRIEKYLLQVHVAFSRGNDVANWTTHVMRARPLSGRIAPVDASEFAAVRWISWDELLKEVNPVLHKTGLGGLRYRARLHERVYELLTASADPGDAVTG
ncbi:MAG: NUDIX domain-containing protein [Acidobacteriota bacterium]